MLIWDGACIVHESFKAHALLALKVQHPDAAVLAHPEAPAPVLALADVVGSTSQLLRAAQLLPQQKLIVATDRGIFYKMQQAVPNKLLMEAPTAGIGATCASCAQCPWMAMNELRDVARVLETGANEVFVAEATRANAYRSTQRMLEFARTLSTGTAS